MTAILSWVPLEATQVAVPTGRARRAPEDAVDRHQLSVEGLVQRRAVALVPLGHGRPGGLDPAFMGVGAAHEALEHVLLGRGPAQLGEQAGLDPRRALAVDEHAVAVEDHELDRHPGHATERPCGRPRDTSVASRARSRRVTVRPWR